MSKQPEKKSRSFWPIVNALTAPLAFLIIGYVVWSAINAKPRVIPVASAPTFTVIDPNGPEQSDDSEQESSEDKPVSPADTSESAADASDAPKEDPKQDPVDGSGSKEPATTPEPETLPAASDADVGSTPTKDSSPPADVPDQADSESDPVPDPKPEASPKPKVALGPAPNFYNADVAKFLFEKKCSECHKLKRVENHTFADVTAVERLIDKMVENGLEVNEKERSFLGYYVKSAFVD